MYGALPAELIPHSFGTNKKHHTFLCSAFVLVENTGPVSNHGELLQSMYGALPAELIPYSFGTNKKALYTSVQRFLSGGEYRDRTGDLLHAMQALSQLS